MFTTNGTDQPLLLTVSACYVFITMKQWLYQTIIMRSICVWSNEVMLSVWWSLGQSFFDLKTKQFRPENQYFDLKNQNLDKFVWPKNFELKNQSFNIKKPKFWEIF